MASVLSLSPPPFAHGAHESSPLFRRSFSSLASIRSEGALLHACRQRHPSVCSVLTRSSSFGAYAHNGPYFCAEPTSTATLNRDTSPSRSSNCSDISATPSLAHTGSWASVNEAGEEEQNGGESQAYDGRSPDEIYSNDWPLSSETAAHCNSNGWQEPAETQDEIDHCFIERTSTTLSLTQPSLQSQNFRRWVSTLRRRNPARKRAIDESLSLQNNSPNPDGSPGEPSVHHSRSGSCVSSLAFVTGVRSASMTMTTMSLLSTSAAASARSPRSVLYVTSEPPSRTDLRRSMDSDNASLAPRLDEAAIKRSFKRARKIQELVKTEEGYLSDLKSLQNAKRFTIYEEYGARCDSMQMEVDMQRFQPSSLEYDRALETLQASVCPSQEKVRALKKALGLKDLLIKPSDFGFRDFGRLLLCGALYIAYRGTTNIKGQYAICVLYESCLVVAATSGANKYKVLLALSLAHATLHEADNGKALQCHTTPYTWKILFESEGAMFEILCVACSAVEAESWRQRITGRMAVEGHHVQEGSITPVEISSPLTQDMRSVGKAYGRNAHFRRRASVQRAATLGALSEVNQVMIKNTQAGGKDTTASSGSLPVERSQSLMTPSHFSVLAPRRSDRIHLEALLVDVWTRDALPFPGLGSKRGEYSMRASANHVIRKLSIASITSNFSKRSMSFTTVGTSGEDRNTRGRVKPRNMPPNKVLKKPQGPKVINFHTAPEAFLPEDFDLRNPAKARGRLVGSRTFTMGSERPKAGVFASGTDSCDHSSPGIKRSRSVVTRRRRSDFEAELASEQRTTTSMSTPAVLEAADRAENRRPLASTESGSRDMRVGMRQRARSRLARLLG
ncbi:hypothetical protein ANO11243_054020 [Dothideomycetidae sp. 11243]|nr:hypothetical protein ANO11243_054020 [fungal sp. No.11243]